MPVKKQLPLQEVGFLKQLRVPGHQNSPMAEYDNVNVRYRGITAFLTTYEIELHYKGTEIHVPMSNVAYYILA